MSHTARTEILTSGAKALLLINGGGIVALLGVLTKLLPPTKDDEKYFASVVLLGIGMLSAGLVIAAANYYFRFWASTYWERGETGKHSLYFGLERLSVLFSFGFFVLGVSTVVLRMYFHLSAS